MELTAGKHLVYTLPSFPPPRQHIAHAWRSGLKRSLGSATFSVMVHLVPHLASRATIQPVHQLSASGECRAVVVHAGWGQCPSWVTWKVSGSARSDDSSARSDGDSAAL
eukprot:24722-Chlamydomonas_euryale.AAC.2